LSDFGNSAIALGQRLLAVSTETDTTARQFYDEHRHDLVRSGRYYRFNVTRGLEGVGLEEAEKKSLIIRATKDYLSDGETLDKMNQCVEKLAKHECASSYA